MSVILHDIYSRIANDIWTAKDAGIFLSASNFPQPFKEIATNSLVIKKRTGCYNGTFRVDALDFFASKEIFAHFGLLIMAAVFWPEPHRIELNLTNNASDIKFIILEYCHAPEHIIPGYHTRPHLFSYYPKVAHRHPWINNNFPRNALPLFRLSNLNDFCHSKEDWEQRDTIFGLGSDRGCANFAELLLNISWPNSVCDEFHLECDAGFCAVDTCSAEAHIWLPNSFGWIDFETEV